MTRAEKVIWAAGFLDGEAFIGLSIYVYKGSVRPGGSVIVDAAQNKPEPLERLVELFGGKVARRKNAYGDFFVWRLYSRKAVAVLRECLPYFAVKRQIAELVVEFSETKNPAVQEAIKALNTRRRVQAERLSPETPETGDAIVRPYAN